MDREKFKKILGIENDEWDVEVNYSPMMIDYYTINDTSVTRRFQNKYGDDVGQWQEEELTFEEYLKEEDINYVV